MAAVVDSAQSQGDKGNPFDDLKKLVDYFLDPATSWQVKALAIIALLIVVAPVISALPPVIRECVNVIRWAAGRRLSAERRRRRKRQTFARHLDNQLRQLELQEDWRDEKYAELEAEVEIEQTWRTRWMRRLLPFRRSTLRRVRSLSQALSRSGVPLVLLEGEPGAGKSIALRHLARMLAKRAAKSTKVDGTIPLYINLKQLDIRPDEVNAAQIRTFALATLNEVNSRDVQEVLDTEFDRGLEEGTWLFLFDSFDEIPDLLSAQDTRRVAPLYAQAIADFLGPFSKCRGVVASRDFTSPDSSQYTRFRILRLSERQQRKLIRRADLDRPVDRALRSGLATASQDVATFASNPMFLGLLCEHMRTTGQFPANSHAVFEDYLGHRLQRDAQRIKARFAVEVDFVRAGAEEIAFLMASVPRMGLTPSKEMLLASASGLDTLTPRWVGTILEALEYSKLGRTDVNTAGKATFSFVHRRFQEYFATCVVIHEGRRVPVASLLDNDQWRETAVTLLQIQSKQDTEPLLTEAQERLAVFAEQTLTGDFRWPDGCLHLLRILSTGLESREDAVREPLQPLIDQILVRAWDDGNRLDKRRALDFVLLAGTPVAERLLTEAFRSRNDLLREGAFRNAGTLPDLSPALRAQIRRTLLGRATSIDLYVNRAATVAQVKRLAQPSGFLRLLDLLTIALPVSVLFATAGFLTQMRLTADSFLADEFIVMFAVPFYLGLGDVMMIRLAFSEAALSRRGGHLAEALSRSTLLEEQVMRAARIGAVLLSHAALCFISAAYLISSPPFAVAFTAYGALWPAAIIWCTRNGMGTVVKLWLLLPVLMVVVGGARLPHWLRQRDRALMQWGGPTARRQLIAAVGRMLRPTRRKVRYLFVILCSFTLVPIAVGAALVFVPRTTYLVTAMAVAFIAALGFLMSASPLRSITEKVQTGDDVLALFAKVRSPWALVSVINRLGIQRVARDPSARNAIENLVGEIERAQPRTRLEQGVLLRTACPSLVGHPAPRQWFLDVRPLRRLTSMHVSGVSENVLDELARLADKD